MNTALEDILDHSEEFLDITGRIQSEQVASYDDVVSIESAFPGFITSRCDIHGLTETASLENFGKIKDAVVNAVKAIIEKIKAFIRGIINFFKGGSGGGGSSGTEVAKKIEKAEEKLQDNIKKAEEKPQDNIKKADSTYKGYNPYENAEDRDENGSIRVLHTGVNSKINDISSQEILQLFLHRKITVDTFFSLEISKDLDFPLLWGGIDEQLKVMSLFDKVKWQALPERFKRIISDIPEGEDETVTETTRRGERKTPVSTYGNLRVRDLDNWGEGDDKGLLRSFLIDFLKDTDYYGNKVLYPFLNKYTEGSVQKMSRTGSGDVEENVTLYPLLKLLITPRKTLVKEDSDLEKNPATPTLEHVKDTLEKVVTPYTEKLKDILQVIDKVLDVMEAYSKKYDKETPQRQKVIDLFFSGASGTGLTFFNMLGHISAASRAVGLVLTKFRNMIEDSDKLAERISKASASLEEKLTNLKEGWVKPETEEDIMRALEDPNVKGIVF